MIDINLNWKTVAAAGAVGLVLTLYMQGRAKAVAETVVDNLDKVDPVNPDNIFNAWFNRAYKAVTGSDQSLGADIYDWTHENEQEILNR